ncbi:MAG: response regulator transcription factor [Spirochaetales bacterium]|nr:MAG: response regulator transcription factor [Spirochaetales bacterium]
MTILLAEDDSYTREGLEDILAGEGYDVTAAGDGEEALKLFSETAPDLVILDIMMPKINGYDVCRTIRKQDRLVPVIFLSAKSEEIDKVLGLELGADDYISKPFGIKEVIARVRAVYRRYSAASEETGSGSAEAGPSAGPEEGGVPFPLGDLLVRPSELRAVRGNDDIDLSLRDVRILALFAANKGKVLDRDIIYNAGWGEAHLPNSRTLDQHISQLRKKIESDPKDPRIIVTVHNAGYRYP